MMLNSTSIGNKIASARKKAGLSQADLAQQVSISAQAVGKWERGESMPDISTLNRLAELLGVDLNYFSDSFPSATQEKAASAPFKISDARPPFETGRTPERDMSKMNLADSDFSGLSNLHEKFSSSNMQKCLFIGSNLSGLLLNSNNVDTCDFTGSDISQSRIQSSNLGGNSFKNCSLRETEFSKSNIFGCDFTGADMSKATLRTCNFMKNILTNVKWKGTSFFEMSMQDIVFEGHIEDCSFENSAFHNVQFRNATLTNTFFKNNRKFKKVKFSNCKADKITYAFLKNNLADMTGISIL